MATIATRNQIALTPGVWAWQRPGHIEAMVPWPPTVNHMHDHIEGGKKVLTAEARAFRQAVIEICRVHSIKALTGRLAISIYQYPPNARCGDIDNRIKPLLDALQHAGCFKNDVAVDRLLVERGFPQQPHAGACRVAIRTIA